MPNMENTQYEYLMSRIKYVSTIKETEKTKISLVYYEGNGGTAILRVCKGRNLSDLCQMLMKVRNSNVAVVYDYVYYGGDTYILEEYLAGRTLQELYENKGVFSEKETARIIINVCNGLKELHGKVPPIVHNDIKMENIMVRDDGGIKLFDFDAARTYKAGKDKNTRLLGTEEYAAPEHRGYGQSEPRTDIYSLGVTMHYMLTGCGLKNDHKISYKGPLKSVIKKCVEIDYKRRYFSVQRLAKDLEKRTHFGRRVLKFVTISGLSLLALLFIFILSILFAIGLESSNETESINDEVYTETVSIENEVNNSIENSLLLEQEPEEELTIDGPGEEDITESPEEITADEEVVQEEETSDVLVREKKMELVDKVEGTLVSMLALNDGTFLALEVIDGDYVIRSSAGQEYILLEDTYFSRGAKLIYNNYSEELYFLGFMGTRMTVYSVSEKMEVKEVANIDYDSNSYVSDMSIMSCAFFPDGILYCNYIKKYIDTENWIVLGDAYIGGVGAISDKLYARGSEFPLVEIDEYGNVIKGYPLSGFYSENYDLELYFDGQYAYFVESGEDERSYLYQFDGKDYVPVICLDDYKYYTDFRMDHLCVTDDVMRCYDVKEKTIKEFVIK